MRWVNNRGDVGRGRRWPSKQASVSSEEVKDPTKLAEIIRQLSARVSELEARTGPESVEFEKDVTGTTVSPQSLSLAHGFGGPVRWFVTYWRGGITVSPAVAEQTTSTKDRLDLNVYSTGRIVIRIEPSQFGLS